MVEIGLIRPTNPQNWIATNIRRIADEFYHKCLKASYTSRKIGKTEGTFTRFFNVLKYYNIFLFL